MGKYLLGAAVAAAVVASGAAAWADQADDLIAKHVQARGGADQISAVKSVVMTGKVRPPGFDSDVTYVETVSRPENVRMELTLQGLTVVQAWDGRSGWQIQPFQGRKDPEKLSADDSKSLQEEADFDGPLVNWRAKGNQVQYLGMEDVDGAPAHAFRAKLKNGDEETIYLDPDAMMVIRVVAKQIIRGAEQQTVTDYGDYEKVNGVYFPFEIESGPRERPNVRQRITFDKITVNPTVDPATFAMPSGPAAAAR
jgi:outer membrane lipoprotein-sorting protein